MSAETMAHTFMLTNVISAVPAFVMLIAGIVLAIVRWKSHPKASLFAIIGFFVMLVTRVLSNVFNAMVAYAMSRNAAAASSLAIGLSAFDALLVGGAWTLIIAAIFCKRPAPQPATSVYGEPVEQPAES